MKIGIIEDDDTILYTLTLKLKKEGYEVVGSSNGMDGLEMIEREKPNLVVVDILLPMLSGMQVIGKVRENEQLKHIPILVLTTLGQEENIQEAFELGADDYLRKPVSLMELTLRIKKLLK